MTLALALSTSRWRHNAKTSVTVVGLILNMDVRFFPVLLLAVNTFLLNLQYAEALGLQQRKGKHRILLFKADFLIYIQEMFQEIISL